MFFLLMLFLAYLSSLVIWGILNRTKKISKNAMTAYLVVGLFYFAIIISYFFIGKYKGNIETLLFVDEYTYLLSTYELGLFGIYTKFLYKVGGITLIKMANLFFFTLGFLVLYETMNQLKIKLNVWLSFFIISALSLFSYWAFFILKEANTFFGIALYLSYSLNKNKRLKVVSFLVLAVTRLNLIVLILSMEIIFKFLKKSKVKMFVFISSFLAAIVLFFNSTHSYTFKLGILARRFGASTKQFDSDAQAAANSGFLKFISSEEYAQAIMTNLNETFNPFSGDTIFISLLILINIISVLIIFLYLKPEKDIKLYLFIAIMVFLIMQHSSFRYINSIIIPFLIYFSSKKVYK